MSRADMLSMIAVALMLWWVQMVTGEGAITIILDALPDLGIQ